MRGDAKDVKRRPWTTEEMLKFFKTVDADSDLWAVAAIGLYSGMRLNEICEARTEDIKSNRIHIREGKSKAAIRTVPVHPVIAPLVKQLVKNSKDGYLISRLKPGGPDGKRSWNISKRFGRHLRQAGITDRAAVFHSLRANFTTALERARVPLNEIQTLIGHERKELALTAYSVGVSHKQLAEDVELVSFGKGVDKLVAGRIGELTD
jgi:integrase